MSVTPALRSRYQKIPRAHWPSRQNSELWVQWGTLTWGNKVGRVIEEDAMSSQVSTCEHTGKHTHTHLCVLIFIRSRVKHMWSETKPIRTADFPGQWLAWAHNLSQNEGHRWRMCSGSSHWTKIHLRMNLKSQDYHHAAHKLGKALCWLEPRRKLSQDSSSLGSSSCSIQGPGQESRLH